MKVFEISFIDWEMMFRDKDYILTKEGLYFYVVGYSHPRDRAIAFLKYAPSKEGKWKGQFERILKYYSAPFRKSSLEFLEMYYPHYIYHARLWGVKISAVHKRFISKYFKPEEKLQQLRNQEKLDELQLKAIELADLISEESGVKHRYFGITGSILIDIHQVGVSDIDLVILGEENVKAVKECIDNLYESGKIEHYSPSRLYSWCKEISSLYPVSIDQAKIFYKRKWTRGIFKGADFVINPVRLEYKEKYGDKKFVPKGFVEVKARVSKSDSLFIPSVFQVEDVEVTKGPKVKIREIVSYDGIYCEAICEEDRIIAYGKLELVEDRVKGESYYRVLIGSNEAEGHDFIQIIQPC